MKHPTWRGFFIALFVLEGIVCGVGSDVEKQEEGSFVIIGVSGGLQGGFPERIRLDYHHGQDDQVPAHFLGKALVRGYRSYLDVMQDGWRQYTEDPDPNVLINCNVIPTGCWNHANLYWIYAVDSRQFATILFEEPRFLSITPDLGLIDLTAEETSPMVQRIAHHEILRQNKTDFSLVSFPIVTGAWFHSESHFPSPVLYTKPDGTQVTNFPQSLGKWIGIDVGSTKDYYHSKESFGFLEPGRPSETFFDAVRNTVRRHEHLRSEVSWEDHVESQRCSKKARFGVSKDMARVNYAFTASELSALLRYGSSTDEL